ncbi:MAG: TrkA C-terminal domain-containing protein, partial [Candidatus Pacearchaeota archaeon]
PIMGTGFIIAIFLIFIARPISVFLCFPSSKYTFSEKIFLSWVGLRGATPIILATFPYNNGIEKSETIFNIVFFVVLTSLILQGSSIVKVANVLKLSVKQKKISRYPFEFENREGSDTKLIEYIVPYTSAVEDKSLVELKIPEGCLIALICRGDDYIIPNGKEKLQAGDVLLVLVNQNAELEFTKFLQNTET